MLPWFTKYPNQNDEILNLDWVIRQVENLKAAYEAFLAANSLTFADPIVWDIIKQYSKNTIVLSPEGDAYLSKKVVGAGIQLNNTDYWLEIFNFAEYVRTANSNLTMHIEQNTTRATEAYAVDDWLLWEDVLYKVTATIAADDLLTVGTNIVHFTVEDFCRTWQTYMVNTIAQYKADIDASELAYKQQLDQTVLQYKNDIDASELTYRNQLNSDVTSITSNLQSQLNTAIAGVTVDSEVINARVGFDSTAYATLGEAIRTQVTNIYSALDIMSKVDYVWTLNRSVDATGAIVSSNYTAITDRIKAETGDIVIRLIQNADANDKHLAMYVSEYQGTTFLRRTEILYVNNTVTIGSNTDNIIISFGRYSSSGINISDSDISTYFGARLFRTALSKADADNICFIARGNVIALGYTALADCTDIGIYTFTGSDINSITDAPDGLHTGGLLITYKSGAIIWQDIINSSCHFRRYSTTGYWWNLYENQILAEYTSASGSDNSTEAINIYINDSVNYNNSIRYYFGHCVDNDVNADVWRLMYLYSHTAAGVDTQMTRRGEFECALKLSGRGDFSGGIVHGDEIDQSVEFFVDGRKTSKSSISGYMNELKIVRNSILYDPADSTTPIAKHGVEYIFNNKGLTINQSVKWLVNATLANCFMAMLPILKTFSTYRYDNTSFEVVENDDTDYSVTIPNATSVTEYIDNVNSTMSISEYPSGLAGGDCALITDNQGENYNKVYFIITTGDTITSGTLWKSSTHYRINL